MSYYDIKEGDRVRIIDGRFRGKRGRVIHKLGWAVLVLIDSQIDSFTAAIVYIEYLEKLRGS